MPGLRPHHGSLLLKEAGERRKQEDSCCRLSFAGDCFASAHVVLYINMAINNMAEDVSLPTYYQMDDTAALQVTQPGLLAPHS